MKTNSVEIARIYRKADIGYGYLKYPDAEGKVQKEKAVVALLGDSLNAGEAKGVDVLTVDGIEYLIGDAVYKLGRKPITANETVNRAYNVAYKVLALYALAKTYEPAEKTTLVTGLPFQNLDETDIIKEVLEMSHKVKLNGLELTIDLDEVIVSSQGLGTFYSLVRQRGVAVLRKKILLSDLGFKTSNYLPLNNGDIDVDTVKTNRDLGIQDAYKKIAEAVNVEFKANYRFYDVDDLLDKGVATQTVEKGLSYTPIAEKPYVKEALSAYAHDVWADILDKYGEKYREDLEEVVFAGGTAQRVESYLNEHKKHYCSFVEDAQDVQVLGYGEIAKKVEEQRSKAV